MVPRRYSTSFGGGQLEKGQHWHLASCLPYNWVCLGFAAYGCKAQTYPIACEPRAMVTATVVVIRGKAQTHPIACELQAAIKTCTWGQVVSQWHVASSRNKKQMRMRDY